MSVARLRVNEIGILGPTEPLPWERRHPVSVFGHWHGPGRRVPRDVPFVLPAYRPRDAQHTVLRAVICEHLETFLRETTERGEGSGFTSPAAITA